MSSPAPKQVVTDFDLLSPSTPTRLSTSPPNQLSQSPPVGILQNASSPMSFKKRTASKSAGRGAGLLGGILSRSNEEESSVIPSPAAAGSRSEAPNRISMPPPPFRRVSQSAYSNAMDSDEEDEDNAGGQPCGRPRGPSLKWTRSVSRAQGRKSFGGTSGFGRQPPLRNPLLLSPSEESQMGGRRSPGGFDDEEELIVEATPLPTIPIIVLCVALFGEFLSASLSSPFLYFMIEDFGVGAGPDGGGEALVGFWTGVVSSVFFLSQFLTSLLWVSVAEKHGRRAVLFASLLGNGLSVMAFGTSKNLPTAITIRFAMGLFNGAVGVARSAVQGITDPTNESRAFTYMGLAWGLGGIVGSIIGGLAENPVKNHPRWFGDSVLFTEYPYLLPCLIAGSITTSGALLSLFLNPDGGPRTGSIQLPSEKDVHRATRSFGCLLRSLVLKVVALVRRDSGVRLLTSHSTGNVPLQSSHGAVPPPPSALSPLPTPSPDERSPLGQRRPSKFAGSAYGYSTSRQPSEAGGMRIPSRRFASRSGYRSMSVATSNAYAPDYDLDRGDFSFAQRLLMANEQAVFSISDLWVANATREADDYSQVDYEESVFEDEESRIGGSHHGDESPSNHDGEPDFFGYGSAPPSMEDLRDHARRQEGGSGHVSPTLAVPGGHSRSRSPSQDRAMLSPARERVVSYAGTGRLRRGSVASSSVRGGGVSIFANTGLDDDTLATAHAQGQHSQAQRNADESAFNPSMAAIPETGRPASVVEHDVTTPDNRSAVEEEKPEQSLIRQLPLGMIAQYSLLALHGCTCDQVFMSFLVTPVPSGGLGLRAANYALLVSFMMLVSFVWQFRFYPFVGPPNGSLSHLAMFRLGLLLYLPVYILFPELRGLLRESGNSFLVMVGMITLSAIRYLASTCSYTAVMVLVNAMTPPHLVPLANGLAQSSVSLARFIGPLIGGTIWAASIADGPSAHPWPFNYAAGFIAIACLCFAGFLHSFRIH